MVLHRADRQKLTKPGVCLLILVGLGLLVADPARLWVPCCCVWLGASRSRGEQSGEGPHPFRRVQSRAVFHLRSRSTCLMASEGGRGHSRVCADHDHRPRKEASALKQTMWQGRQMSDAAWTGRIEQTYCVTGFGLPIANSIGLLHYQ